MTQPRQPVPTKKVNMASLISQTGVENRDAKKALRDWDRPHGGALCLGHNTLLELNGAKRPAQRVTR